MIKDYEFQGTQYKDFGDFGMDRRLGQIRNAQPWRTSICEYMDDLESWTYR